MIRLIIHGTSMEEISIGLDQFQAALDLMPLAQDIEEFLIQDNAEARRAGLDLEDQPLAELKPITIATRKGDPFADPLVPHGELSRVVSDFETEITDLGDSAIAITGAWPNTPFVALHADGYISRGGNPVPERDIVGIRPSAMLVIQRMANDWIRNQTGATDE